MSEKNSLRSTWLGLALFATLGTASARAQEPTALQSACYVPVSGTMYVIKEKNTPATCRDGHVEFSLAAAATSRTSKANAGPSGNGLPTNAQGAFDFSNENGFVAAGTWGTGNIPVISSGTRLMWYPRKAAVRAGIVTGDHWDDLNTGSESAAFGYNTKAIGQRSLAAGGNSIASGNYAFAMGDQSSAIRAASVAMGQQSKAGGIASIALGRGVLANNDYSVALGSWAEAWNNYAMAIGHNAKATGVSSTAIGSAHASGGQAVAIGTADALANGSLSIAIGQSLKASGGGSIAMGDFADTNGKLGAFVIGDRSSTGWTQATADNQFAVRTQRIWFGKSGNATATAGRYIETSTGAYLSSGGAWVSSSDSAKKHLWQEVDGEEILSRLSSLPVRSWSYREEGDSVRHLGPTAQDFRNAFGLGDTDKAIAAVDADGISLAGIKALLHRTNDLHRENETLRALLAEVMRRLTALETGRR